MAWIIFQLIRKIISSNQASTEVIILSNSLNNQFQINEVINRCKFYVPDLDVKVVKNLEIKNLQVDFLFDKTSILLLGETKSIPTWISQARGGIFNVDYSQNPSDGWEWHNLISYISPAKKDYLSESKVRFIKNIEKLREEKLDKTYIFGTGTSLSKAIDKNWSDGYRIVCNTIVRDKILWHHIDPHFIVAGDAVYHFGHTDFAKTFREDLIKRLSESETLFVYPSIFHSFISREFSSFSDRLIPIGGGNHSQINLDLTQKFELPTLGNVLGLLLLPLACTLSKNVYLWGFDGRAPDDKLFWSNSSQHSYPELMKTLQDAHPAFFDFYLDRQDPLKYIKNYHGDSLDKEITNAELNGWKFIMLHPSYTDTLMKRYINN